MSRKSIEAAVDKIVREVIAKKMTFAEGVESLTGPPANFTKDAATWLFSNRTKGKL